MASNLELAREIANTAAIRDERHRREAIEAIMRKQVQAESSKLYGGGMAIAGGFYGGPLNHDFPPWPEPGPEPNVESPWANATRVFSGRYLPNPTIDSITCRRMALRVGIYNAQRNRGSWPTDPI
jgi:hypothetical protein